MPVFVRTWAFLLKEYMGNKIIAEVITKHEKLIECSLCNDRDNRLDRYPNEKMFVLAVNGCKVFLCMDHAHEFRSNIIGLNFCEDW